MNTSEFSPEAKAIRENIESLKQTNLYFENNIRRIRTEIAALQELKAEQATLKDVNERLEAEHNALYRTLDSLKSNTA